MALLSESLLGFDWVIEPTQSKDVIKCEICCDGLCCDSLKFDV